MTTLNELLGPASDGPGASNDSPRLLTVQEAAAHFRVREATIQRWCRDGRLQAYRTGKSWRIPIESAPPTALSATAEQESPQLGGGRSGASAGRHFLMVVNEDLGLDDVLAPLRLKGERVSYLQIVRFKLESQGRPSEGATLAKAQRGWDQILSAIGQNQPAVALVDGDPKAAFGGEDAVAEWERHLTRSIGSLPLTIICLRLEQSVLRQPLDGWAGSFAAHDQVWLRGAASSFAVVRQPLDGAA